MATIRIPVDLTWTATSGSPGVNVWHARTGGIGEPGDDVNAICEALEEFYTTIAGLYPVGTTIRYAGEVFGVGDDAESSFDSTSWTVAGTGTGNPLPPANQMLVNWRTGSGGRRGRGRTFIGPVTQGLNESNGTPDETARALLQDAIDGIIAYNVEETNGALGVYSRVDDQIRDFVSGNVPNKFALLTGRRD